MMLRKINNENDTALHEAVRYNHSDVVKLLILEDPDFIYGANSSGGTPLYMAAERGFHELVQIIIDNTHTSPAHSGLTGRTALHAAVICNNEEMTKKILEWKSHLTKEVDENGWSPLHCAAYLGYTSIARQLLETSDECVVYLPVKNDHNKTALLIAASRGHTEIVKLLVSQYPDCCEQVDDNGNNALHLIMIKRGIFHSSGLLNFPWMSFRGLMNEKNDDGKTPLHLLADYQMFGCRMFMKHEMVDKMVLDNNKSTPTDIVLSVEDLHGKKGPILRGLRSAKASSGPLGWQNVIKEDIGGRRIKKEEEISAIMEATKIHLVVAALVATVTFANGFKLPDVYAEKKGKDQGITILAPPPDGYKDSMAWDSERQFYFSIFYYSDILAVSFSVLAVLLYFIMALRNKYAGIEKNVDFFNRLSFIGFILTYCGVLAMVFAFGGGLLSGFGTHTFKL
ncbi:hypothetical protein PVL29_006640 [Vitis rotundifolia]|uniref:PGG domain-containing protein n=1 Tax=Vitis rotundifolia TaxID=103349 RepID=A0AA39A6G8_VITRO|nr:hypothetical protein PVL29_006640 [Vitis rotundifolia]